MEELAFCLLFDGRHAREGWVCCLSILRRQPKARIYVLCLDDAAAQAMECRPVIHVPLHLLEEEHPRLAETRKSRAWPAYTQTTKAFFPTYLMGRYGESLLCYVDSDMYFWGDPGAIPEVMDGGSFMVTSREDPIRPPQGSFNGGFFSCRDDSRARIWFEWWQERCLEWCEWEPGSGGKYTEEGYFNVFADDPGRFGGIRICPHPGINLARWNAHRHSVEHTDGRFVVDGEWPLVCFHYQGFRQEAKWFGLGGPPEGAMRLLYEKYHDMLHPEKSR